MTTKQLICVSGALAVLCALMPGPVRGETFDKTTVFTFSRPISVPGVTLPAGDYMFRIVDTTTGRKVIQVLSGDGKTPYAMLHSIPDVKLEASAEPDVQFMETAKDQPYAVKAWWYPNERIGYEFIYPKQQAREVAEATNEPVLTTKTETTAVEETKVEELARVEPTGVETPVVAEPEPVAAAEVALPPPEVPEPRTELPVTATGIPAFAFFGLLALSLAAGVRVWRLTRA